MSEITQLIEGRNADGGVPSAALFEAAYAELKKLAHARLAGSGHMTLLETTALVNETWLRMSGKSRLSVATRRRFFAYASDVMRSVIVDQARQRLAACRGSGEKACSLNTAIGNGVEQEDHALEIHEALQCLANVEPRLARVVEMRYFGGLTEAEIAEALDLTDRTVRRDWEKARLLLAAMLQ